MLVQVLLVVILSRRERTRLDDLGHDRLLPQTAGLRLVLGLLRHFPLLGRSDEDRRAVLTTAIVALLVLAGRVVHLEEPLIEQLLERNALGIEENANGLRVAGTAAL